METMIERGNDGTFRFFESENYYSKREVFEGGIVDDYHGINKDFSECTFPNSWFGYDPSARTYTPYTLDETEELITDEFEEDIIIEIDE